MMVAELAVMLTTFRLVTVCVQYVVFVRGRSIINGGMCIISVDYPQVGHCVCEGQSKWTFVFTG